MKIGGFNFGTGSYITIKINDDETMNLYTVKDGEVTEYTVTEASKKRSTKKKESED